MANKDKINAETKTEDEVVNKLNFDTILIKEIGQVGWFQLRLVVLVGIVVIFVGWSMTEYLFTAARITTRCHVPECEGPEVTEFTPSWVLNAIPASGSSFDNCHRYAPLNATHEIIDMCPQEMFDRNQILPCESFIYENTHSIVYDYNLACDEWRRTLIGSLQTVGTLLALPLAGFISDRFGRRTVIVLAAINTAWLGVVRYWANTYVGFVISQLAESFFGTGVFTSAYILFMEMTGPKYRVVGGAILSTIFAIGQMTTGLIAWAIPDWRKLTLALYIPQFIAIFYIWIMTESVRWYLSKGYFEQAENVLKLAARMNNKQLSDKSLQALRNNAEEEKKLKALQEGQKLNEPWLPVQIIRNKSILKRVLISPIWWITTTFVYYGLSINSVNMVGNRYLNFVLVCAVEIPGYWTAVLLMGRVGRKPVLIGAYWICALCQISYIFIPRDLYAISLTVYLIGKYSISTVLTSMYVYTAELYPTKYRHSLFAYSSMIGRIGSILTPLTPALGAAAWEKLPFAIFAALAILAGTVAFLTPETLNTKLPDTMEEATKMDVKK